MCLSKVYLNPREEGNLLLEEVTRITRQGKSLVVRDLMGQRKEVKSGFIREVDFIDNYVILDDEQTSEK